MRWLGGILIVLVAAWVQISWFGQLRPLGVIPNVMIVTIVLFSLWANATSCMAAALGGGLLLDMASGADFGLRTAFFMVLALAVVAGRQLGMHAEAFITAVGVVAVATILYNIAVLTTFSASFSAIIPLRIGAELIDVTVLTAVIYLVRLLINDRRPSKQTSLEVWR